MRGFIAAAATLAALGAATAAPRRATSCTGNSTKLAPAQCAAWINFYTATSGDAWAQCSGLGTDPCSCVVIMGPGDTSPVCNPDGTTVLSIHLAKSGLKGTLPASIGAFTDLKIFAVPSNQIEGSFPASASAWQQLTWLEVDGNKFTGVLPALPFGKMGDHCFISGNPPTNAFACPWPAGALQFCQAQDSRAKWHPLAVTGTACVTPCTGASKNLAVDQCLAWIDFYDALHGSGWRVCNETRTDPCACAGTFGTAPVCNPGGTVVTQIMLTDPKWTPTTRLVYGTLPDSIGAFVNITAFNIADYGGRITGSIPASIGAWKALTSFEVYANSFAGAPLPNLPFEQLTTCTLLDHVWGGSASFDCPWPPGATDHCKKYMKGGSGSALITKDDCTGYSCDRATGQCMPDPNSTQPVGACVAAVCSKCTGSSMALALAECDAWQAFYDASNGPRWAVFAATGRQDPCSMQPSGSYGNGVTCNDGHITSVTLVANNLLGNLTDIIAHISALEVLNNFNVYGNMLGGTIPDTIGDLRALAILNMGSCGLMGTIPAAIVKLTALTGGLYLDSNFLTGSISLPPNLHTSCFIYYSPFTNRFSCPVTEFALANCIKQGGASAKDFTLMAPTDCFCDPGSGFVVSSGRCEPCSAGHFSAGGKAPLGCLACPGGQFSPSGAAVCSKCSGTSVKLEPVQCDTWIDFYDSMSGNAWTECNATKTDPCSCSRVSCGGDDRMILQISLASNNLAGMIPQSMGAFTNITHFDVSYNSVMGTIPPELGSWKSIQYFAVAANNLTGPIPVQLASWTQITNFYIYYNRMSGSIPAELTSWTKLTFFDVQGNYFEGPLPSLLFQRMPYVPGVGGCYLFSNQGQARNRFSCPWPVNATKICVKALGDGWVPITGTDCAALTPAPTPALTPIPTSSHGAALAGGLCAAALLFGAGVLLRRRHGGRAGPFSRLDKHDPSGMMLTTGNAPHQADNPSYIAPTVVVTAPQPSAGGKAARSSAIALTDIELATENFAPHNKLAEGAFGAVYRGRHNNCTVAIKVLTRKDDPDAAHSDYSGANSFALEAKVLGQYRHANIVGLIGHCLGPEQPQQFLMYEFMPGGSLLNRLDLEGAAAPLTWQERHIVASDTARGLEYLHVEADPPIIHQDIKSDNILLAEYDGHFVAKIADFGAVRIAPTLLVTNVSHYTAREVIGTKPYQPPEYTGQGHVSEKTDTFAFGVVLLELLTAKKPSNKDTSEFLYAELEPVMRLASKLLPPLLDARAGKWPRKKALALAKIAKKCLEMFPRNRCAVCDVLVELDVLAGRKAVVRAGRGEEYDPMTGKLVKTDIARPGSKKQKHKHKAAGTRSTT